MSGKNTFHEVHLSYDKVACSQYALLPFVMPGQFWALNDFKTYSFSSFPIFCMHSLELCLQLIEILLYILPVFQSIIFVGWVYLIY